MLELQTQTLISLQGQLTYTQGVLNNGGLKEWETKEYKNVSSLLVDEITEQEALIKRIQEIS